MRVRRPTCLFYVQLWASVSHRHAGGASSPSSHLVIHFLIIFLARGIALPIRFPNFPHDQLLLPVLLFTLSRFFGLELLQLLAEPTIVPDAVAILDECKRDNAHPQTEKTKQTARPCNAQGGKHRMCGKGQHGAKDA